MKRVLAVVLCAAVLSACASPHSPGLVIAHRGASGYLPEHTLEAYALAHGLGADFIEPDVVLTRDGVPICAHDITAEAVTNVKEVFPGRARPDGKWYWCDLTLAEVKRLSVRGRGAKERPDDAVGMQVATLDEMIALVRRLNDRRGTRVGIIPELKDPAFHAKEGLPLIESVVGTLARNGYAARTDGAIIQCFDLPTLRAVRERGCDLRLMWTVKEAPSNAQLEDAARVVNAIGPSRKAIEPETGGVTDLVARAHARGLIIVPYTFGNEPEAVSRFFRERRVDGLFTDYPDVQRSDTVYK